MVVISMIMFFAPLPDFLPRFSLVIPLVLPVGDKVRLEVAVFFGVGELVWEVGLGGCCGEGGEGGLGVEGKGEGLGFWLDKWVLCWR